MNTIRFLCAAAVLAAASGARAASIAFDNASDAAYNSGWGNGSNGGSGFGAWTLQAAGGSFGGHFIGSSSDNAGGSSGNINTSGNKSWGMYANTSNITDAIRPFTGNLTPTVQSFVIDMDNGFIDSSGSPQPTEGFALRNSAHTDRLNWFFQGGQSFYQYVDSTGTHTTSIGFTGNGMHIVVTLTGTDTYQMQVTPSGGGTSTFSGTLADGAGTGVSEVRLYDSNGGSGSNSNLYFNSMQITPEPGSIALLGLAAPLLMRRARR
jgi:hypothetical protein